MYFCVSNSDGLLSFRDNWFTFSLVSFLLNSCTSRFQLLGIFQYQIPTFFFTFPSPTILPSFSLSLSPSLSLSLSLSIYLSFSIFGFIRNKKKNETNDDRVSSGFTIILKDNELIDNELRELGLFRSTLTRVVENDAGRRRHRRRRRRR